MSKNTTIAAYTVLNAFKSRVVPAVFRQDLLDAGVLKGTVSKAFLILIALREDIIKPEQVKSLSQAYHLVKMHDVALELAFDIYVDHSDYDAKDAMNLTEREWYEFVTPRPVYQRWDFIAIREEIVKRAELILERIAR